MATQYFPVPANLISIFLRFSVLKRGIKRGHNSTQQISMLAQSYRWSSGGKSIRMERRGWPEELSLIGRSGIQHVVADQLQLKLFFVWETWYCAVWEDSGNKEGFFVSALHVCVVNLKLIFLKMWLYCFTLSTLSRGKVGHIGNISLFRW